MLNVKGTFLVVLKDKTTSLLYFLKVSFAGEAELQIGGYQPLEKWLKDRKGRKLTTEDVQHYLRMIIALRETRRIMGEIDNIIPMWPLP